MKTSGYTPDYVHAFRLVTRTKTPDAPAESTPMRRSGPGTILCFGITLFLSASLLFLVQPMMGKMILPLLGGTPAVWNTCMLFFQAVLLVGYAYAHVTTSLLGVRAQSVLHLGVILLPLLVLPIGLSAVNAAPTHGSPIFWLLGCLTLNIGLPFFVVSTTGPLLQRWFAETSHQSAEDPFFLYAASNVGSLLALLGYPLVVEPLMVLTDQSQLWTYGYAAFVMLIGGCTVLLWRCGSERGHPSPETPGDTAVDSHDGSAETSPENAGTRTEAGQHTADHSPLGTGGSARTVVSVTNRRRAWWVFAAFVPSSLMLGVTAHITSNLAPIPLLWVLPLALYLLTFVLVFARSRPIPHRWMVQFFPYMVLPLAVMTFLELPNMAWIAVVVHLLGFFIAAMVCHGELANDRPSAKHLTEFYLWLSIGGVLGGVFNALIAPALFNSIIEYPLTIVLACLLLPNVRAVHFEKRDWVYPAGYAIVAAIILLIVHCAGWGESLGLRFIVFGILAVLCFSFKDRPLRFALGMGVYMLAIANYSAMHRGTELFVSRNFFGVKRVVIDPDDWFHVLIHGNTTHGKQFIDPVRSTEPLTYYHRTGPLGDIFKAKSQPSSWAHIAAVGLGTGSIASYVEPGQSLSAYEIDPEVEQIARDPKLFTFLQQCRGKWKVILGDGRLKLKEAPDHQFGLVLLDAFSSDSIPTHLLTREAVQLYLKKLAPDGMMAFHISNRYLDLKPLLAGLAADAGLTAWFRADVKVSKEEAKLGKTPAIYVAMARTEADLGTLPETKDWKPLTADPKTSVWTDHYTSILSYVQWR